MTTFVPSCPVPPHFVTSYPLSLSLSLCMGSTRSYSVLLPQMTTKCASKYNIATVKSIALVTCIVLTVQCSGKRRQQERERENAMRMGDTRIRRVRSHEGSHQPCTNLTVIPTFDEMLNVVDAIVLVPFVIESPGFKPKIIDFVVREEVDTICDFVLQRACDPDKNTGTREAAFADSCFGGITVPSFVPQQSPKASLVSCQHC